MRRLVRCVDGMMGVRLGRQNGELSVQIAISAFREWEERSADLMGVLVSSVIRKRIASVDMILQDLERGMHMQVISGNEPYSFMYISTMPQHHILTYRLSSI